MLKQLYTAIIVIICSNTSFAQDKMAVGLSGMYNFPMQSIGIGARIQYPVTQRFLLVPQVKYVPKFNQVHELYAGVHAHVLLISRVHKISYYRSQVEPQKPNLYLTMGVDYNRWFDYVPSMSSRAKEHNILPKVGIGSAIGTYRFRFFVEAKYNILWNEGYAEAGLLYYPQYKKSKLSNKCNTR